MSEDFKWTDELAFEFAKRWARDRKVFEFAIPEFKATQSKQNNNKDWEIIASSFPMGQEIKSVRRISDNEVFSVGDFCLQGKIIRFQVSEWSNEVHAYFAYSEEKGCAVRLNDLRKAKQPLFNEAEKSEIIDQLNKLKSLIESK